MYPFKMAALSLSSDAIRPMNRWNYDRIQPGAVGSVGDVNLQVRLKHSYPNLPLRFDKSFSGKNEVFLGSNVTDGSHENYDSGGGPARLIDSNWGGRRHFKYREGYIFQDMRAPDKSTEPLTGATPDYSWHNRLATCYNAKRSGDKFLPLPGGYELGPNQVLRSGTYPRITDVEPGTMSVGSQIVGQVEDQQNLKPRGSRHAAFGGSKFKTSFL